MRTHSSSRRRPMAAAAAAAPNPAGLHRVPGDHIIAALAPYLSFVDHLAHRIVCRAWRRSCRLLGRPPPPFPWLMLPPPPAPAPAGTPQRRVFYDIPGGRSFAYPVPASYRYLASRGGWLVLAASDPPRRLVVLNPITGGRVDVPWPFGEGEEEPTHQVFHAVMTASLVDPACFLAVAKDRVIKYCRPAAGAGAGGGWVTLKAQGFRFDAARSDVASVGTTVYLVDNRRKLWRADLAAAEPKVERRDTAFDLPEGETTWRHYLVESLGHVLLVVSDEHHRRLGLYSLNWAARLWVPTPASGIGNTVLLLGRGCSAAVPASAAAGRSAGTVLAARQPWRWSSSLHMGLNVCRGGGGLPWFWTESRLGAGLGDQQLVLKKTVHQRPGEFSAGDSFWFFPAIDECGSP